MISFLPEPVSSFLIVVGAISYRPAQHTPCRYIRNPNHFEQRLRLMRKAGKCPLPQKCVDSRRLSGYEIADGGKDLAVAGPALAVVQMAKPLNRDFAALILKASGIPDAPEKAACSIEACRFDYAQDMQTLCAQTLLYAAKRNGRACYAMGAWMSKGGVGRKNPCRRLIRLAGGFVFARRNACGRMLGSFAIVRCAKAGRSRFYNRTKWFLLNSSSPSFRILHSSLDMALRSTDRKSASCWRLKGIEKLLLFWRFASSER